MDRKCQFMAGVAAIAILAAWALPGCWENHQGAQDAKGSAVNKENCSMTNGWRGFCSTNRGKVWYGPERDTMDEAQDDAESYGREHPEYEHVMAIVVEKGVALPDAKSMLVPSFSDAAPKKRKATITHGKKLCGNWTSNMGFSLEIKPDRTAILVDSDGSDKLYRWTVLEGASSFGLYSVNKTADGHTQKHEQVFFVDSLGEFQMIVRRPDDETPIPLTRKVYPADPDGSKRRP